MTRCELETNQARLEDGQSGLPYSADRFRVDYM